MKKISRTEVLARLRQLMSHPDALEREWRKTREINYRPALRKMERRIAESERELDGLADRGLTIGRVSRRWFWTAAASLLVLVGVAAWKSMPYFFPATDRPGMVRDVATLIIPGTTQATLRLADGRTIQLGTDAEENARLMAEALNETSTDGKGGTSAAADTARMLRVETPRGGEIHLQLSDGTEVWLNAESALEYPAQFAASERRVKVEGEAFFSVRHDARHPFYVDAKKQELRVLGTQFNIQAYPESQCVSTTLVEGSIVLRHKERPSEATTLAPGDQTVMALTNQRIRKQRVDTEAVTAWRSGKFVFENQTLGQIMQTLSRWYDFDYEFRNPQLARTEFMGTVPRYADFADVLEILSLSGGVTFSQEGRTLVIDKDK